MKSPMTAKTIDELCSLKSDNWGNAEFWIITDGFNVTLCKQKSGERSEASVTIPRVTFNRMVKWYTTPTKGKP